MICCWPWLCCAPGPLTLLRTDLTPYCFSINVIISDTPPPPTLPFTVLEGSKWKKEACLFLLRAGSRVSLPFKRVLREAQSPAKLSSSPVLGEHTCLTSGARCPGTGEMRQAWMVPHLLSPPRAVVVGRRERLGKEGCWGAGWTLKAGSRCERLQDSGAGHRPWGSRSPWTQGAGARDRARWTPGGEEAGLPRAPSAVTTADESREAFPPTLAFNIGLQFAFPPSVPILISTARNYLPTPQLWRL